ncbi:hypothetical protein JCM6882_000013 [Rhodosporidiobolus microsporus]
MLTLDTLPPPILLLLASHLSPPLSASPAEPWLFAPHHARFAHPPAEGVVALSSVNRRLREELRGEVFKAVAMGTAVPEKLEEEAERLREMAEGGESVLECVREVLLSTLTEEGVVQAERCFKASPSAFTRDEEA